MKSIRESLVEKAQAEYHGSILGYDWNVIKSAQQGEPLSRAVDTTKPASRNYYCDRCEKYFKPTSAVESGIQCPKCGFIVVI